MLTLLPILDTTYAYGGGTKLLQHHHTHTHIYTCFMAATAVDVANYPWK